MLKEKVGQLWVGGYHMPFSQIDLKVRGSSVCRAQYIAEFCFISAIRKPVTIMVA